VNELVLVDLKIGGQDVPVALKADRNGFFYVLNRQNGQVISAQTYVPVNWAKGFDNETGRPIENPEKRPRLDVWARDICPNLFGGKNWEPMSYSPDTGLVYIPSFNRCNRVRPAQDSTLLPRQDRREDFCCEPGGWRAVRLRVAAPVKDADALTRLRGFLSVLPLQK